MDKIAESYRRIVEETHSSALYEEVLMEDRVDFLKSKWPEINSSHDVGAMHRNPRDIIDFMANHVDPSKNKQNTQWLVTRYNRGLFRQEDAPRVRETLSAFDAHKHLLPADRRDLNKYHRVSDVQQAVAPVLGKTGEHLKAEKMASQDANEPGFEKRYEDENITIHQLHDADTSQRLFSSPRTEWCTAYKGNSCRFNYYTKDSHERGPLFVVTRKQDGEVFQYHPTSNQFMDKHDDDISTSDLESIKPSLHRAWEQDKSLLSLKD